MQSTSEPNAITGLPDPHVAIHAVGIPAMPCSILKPSFLKNAGQVLRRFNFLKSELAKAEDHVDHDLRLFRHRFNVSHDLLLVIIATIRAGLVDMPASSEVKQSTITTTRKRSLRMWAPD